MAMLRSWPNWQPGQELRADHLIGLEHYLLTRSAFIDAALPGLERFDQDASISVSAAGSALEVSMGALRGLTPGGQPVVLEAEERLTAGLTREDDPSVGFDAAIEVNPRDVEPKFVLRLEKLGGRATLVQPPEPRPERLDLGRF